MPEVAASFKLEVLAFCFEVSCCVLLYFDIGKIDLLVDRSIVSEFVFTLSHLLLLI